MSSQVSPPAEYAKITRPQLPDIYPRRRLYRLLGSHLKNASLWLQGPAGYGKTTLVNGYLEASGLPVLWYRFDERDAEVGNFFHYFALAVRLAAPWEGPPLPVLTPEYLLDVPGFARNFFEQCHQHLKSGEAGSGDAPCVVVFDDCHCLPEDSILFDIMAIALSELPASSRMIFVSRSALPPALTALLANRRIAVTGGDELRLTREETLGLVKHLTKDRHVRAQSQALHETAQGWPAGLILLLEHARTAACSNDWLQHTPASVHDYFMRTVYDGLDTELKDFLLKSAFLPEMSADMAASLSGREDAGQILEGLYRNNFFTEKRVSNIATYQYHALFREFLHEQARQTLPAEKQRQVKQMAASILRKAGQQEEAAALYIEMGDWDELSRVIRRQGELLVRQGRSNLLESWLRRMPENYLHFHPWLMYWLGYCLLYKDPRTARRYFEVAYHGFVERDEDSGLFLSWAAIVDAALANWEFGFLSPWIRRMEQRLRTGDEFPSQEIAARVTAAMFAAVMFLEPWQDKLEQWACRLETCIRECPDYEFKLQSAVFLISYYQWLGRIPEMLSLTGLLRPLGGSNISPVTRVHWCLPEAICAWFIGEAAHCISTVEEGLEICASIGARVLEPLLCTQGVYGALSRGDLDAGKAYLDRIKAAVDAGNRSNRAHYYYLAAWHAVLCDSPAEGIRYLEGALKSSEQEATPFPIACCHAELALLLAEQGELEQAEAHLLTAEEIAARVKAVTLEVKCLLARAFLEEQRGQPEAASAARRQAFGKAHKHGIGILPWWLPNQMAAHCVKALEGGIEPDYVRQLIHRHGLTPAQPPVHLEDWPWELKIYTLGRFAVVKDGAPMIFSGRAQKIPLMLLKTLVALGGRAVPESRISEVMWPAAEVESAHSSFATNLSRLRRLLGDPALLQIENGCLSLNPHRCWVDVWAFERACGRVGNKPGVADSGAIQCAEQALRLYQGGFLSHDDSEDYAVFTMRERLREKFLRLVERLGMSYLTQGRLEAAAGCFERGLQVDELVEEFYYHLMNCYARQGERIKALRLYERCYRVLGGQLGLTPSPKITACYRSLLSKARESR